MSSQPRIGGIVHTYQKYDPRQFPSPASAEPDAVSPAFEHILRYGRYRPLTEEELARAIRLDPSQFGGLGPPLEAILAALLERKRKILERYNPRSALQEAENHFLDQARSVRPPKTYRERFRQAVREEQIYDLEQLWYSLRDDQSIFARQLVQLMESLGEKYQVEELLAKYEFEGATPLSTAEAIQVKAELEEIDRLIRQIEEALQNPQLAIVELNPEDLSEFVEPGLLEQLRDMQKMIEEQIKHLAEQQGLVREGGFFQLSPQAYRLFQSRLLERIFSELQSARTGRHQGPILGEGSVESQLTKPYEFGDSIAQMDIPQTMINAMLRAGTEVPIRLHPEDIVIHRTRNTPRCASVVIMDMSGSMRYDGLYIHVKRMALALDGLIRSEYPGDTLHFLEMATFARPCPRGEIIELLPKPVTLHHPVVRLRVDMSREDISETMIPPHFTNIQHALRLARRLLVNQDSPNRQVILITDGLPTAHFEESRLHLLYPPDPLTEEATLREGLLCSRDGITINIFLIPSWSQSEDDVRFAHRLAESTRGRVFFTAGRDLDRYVIWDYVAQRREIVG